jgi:rhodanese-related sulfurtransferase
MRREMRENDRITIDELRERMKSGEEFVFIDTRNPQAWSESDVVMPGAIRVPLDSFEEHLYDIPKNKSIVTYCT